MNKDKKDYIEIYSKKIDSITVDVTGTRCVSYREDLKELIENCQYVDDELRLNLYVGDELCWLTIKCNGVDDGWEVKWEDDVIFEDEYNVEVILNKVEKIIKNKCTKDV